MATKLYTTYHESDSKARNGEVELCLELNQAVFDEVHVIAQQCNRPQSFRGEWITLDRRQVYFDLLEVARMSVPSDIVVISNSDIIFTQQALDSINSSLAFDECYCLSRWDLTTCGIRLFNRHDSQDAWVFRGAPRCYAGQFAFGVPGCDNRFAYELHKAGYKLSNPSKDVRIFHLHLSGHRPSNQAANRVQPPYVWVKPARLGEPPTITHSDVASKRASAF